MCRTELGRDADLLFFSYSRIWTSHVCDLEIGGMHPNLDGKRCLVACLVSADPSLGFTPIITVLARNTPRLR